MIYAKVTGKDFYRAAYEKFKSEADAIDNAVLEYSKGKLFTAKYCFDAYNNQRTNALKRRPSRARDMKIAPLRFLLKITSLGIDDGFYYEGFDEHYDGADIDLPEFFPVKRTVSLRGEDIVSTKMWKVVNITWFLNKHNGGLVEIVDPSAIDLTEEAAEATRLRLAAERKEILRVQRLKS